MPTFDLVMGLEGWWAGPGEDRPDHKWNKVQDLCLREYDY
jgi:hypothetical protein